jgi:hypothetical protein
MDNPVPITPAIKNNAIVAIIERTTNIILPPNLF